MRYSLGSSSLNSFAAEVQVHAVFAYGEELCSDAAAFIEIITWMNPKLSFDFKANSLITYVLTQLLGELALNSACKADVSYPDNIRWVSTYIYLEEQSLFTKWQIDEHGILDRYEVKYA